MAQLPFGSPSRLFGDSDSLFGVPAEPYTTNHWYILVDWDGDGVYNGVNEGTNCVGLEITRGFNDLYDVGEDGYYGGIAQPAVGTAKIVLNNTSGRYSAWNTGGDLYGLIYPGKNIVIGVRNGYASSTDADLFTGYINDITEDRNKKEVTIHCVDGINYLMDAEANVEYISGFSQFGTNRGTLNSFTKEILDSIGWKWGYNMDEFAASNYGLWHYYSNRRAYTELNEVAKTGQGGDGIFYTNGSGTLIFSQLWDYVVGSTDPQTPTYYGADVFLKDVDITQPWENLITAIKAYVYRIDTAAESVLWSHGTPPFFIEANSSETIWAELSYDSGDKLFYANITTPTSSSDYVANSQADGGGSDLTSNISLTVTGFGRRAKIEVTNSGGTDAYMTTLQLRGVALLLNETYKERETNTNGIYTYLKKKIVTGQKLFQIDTNIPYEVGSYAFDYTGYADFSKVVTAQIQQRSEQFLHDLNDLIAFNISNPDLQEYSTGLAGTSRYGDLANRFRIMKIKHKWQSKNGQDVLTTWMLRHILIY